jgi:hypothetical protein
MKNSLFALLALGVLCLGFAGCGTDKPPVTLSIEPSYSTLVRTNQPAEFFLQLKPILSNGAIPTAVQWTSSNGCNPVNQSAIVFCNDSCGGTTTATITATTQGMTATAQVVCQSHF